MGQIRIYGKSRINKCSVCKSERHNLRTCPIIEKRSETPSDLDELSKEILDRESKYKNVRCSYCSSAGHTKRRCQAFKADRDNFIEASKEFRKHIVLLLVETGLLPGAVFASGDAEVHRRNKRERKYDLATFLVHDETIIVTDITIPLFLHTSSSNFNNITVNVYYRFLTQNLEYRKGSFFGNSYKNRAYVRLDNTLLFVDNPYFCEGSSEQERINTFLDVQESRTIQKNVLFKRLRNKEISTRLIDRTNGIINSIKENIENIKLKKSHLR